ncbi:DUF1203 domain-containing protein [Oricola sp.]|uniref:DUF1203 domain-containing protein n=1 Tax=Oricola sp. TaxID=1979950 RepID=UPI0025FD6C3A|nr:DUF1203 domain-containing protein [Oricola sp.]MCI5073827.1 DUF1203 domain-containing protein [Oricola sp.]
MTEIGFRALETDAVRALQRGGDDAYGNPPQRLVSDGSGIPCRHCLQPVRDGDPFLVLAHRPFDAPQPYAETGPIFLHAEECERASDTDDLAPMFRFGGSYILRGYRSDDWIDYATAEVVEAANIVKTARAMLDRAEVAYLHMRSSRFNCYQARIERA